MANTPTVRTVLQSDKQALLALMHALSVFGESEIAEVSSMLHAYVAAEQDAPDAPGETWIIAQLHNLPIGLAYFAPERMTSETWNLYLIAVHPAQRHNGIGTALLQHTKGMLHLRKARLLLVETSNLPDFEAAQAFYTKHGFEREALIRDFYKAGEHKIVFRKALTV